MNGHLWFRRHPYHANWNLKVIPLQVNVGENVGKLTYVISEEICKHFRHEASAVLIRIFARRMITVAFEGLAIKDFRSASFERTRQRKRVKKAPQTLVSSCDYSFQWRIGLSWRKVSRLANFSGTNNLSHVGANKSLPNKSLI